MKTICFIVPWMGKFPNYFQLWLESCRYNPTVDFLVFTDDRQKYDYPDNVKVYYMEFSELKQLIQKHFSFPICFNRSYKICDFRPAFGEIFHEYINKYDFWGHCDIDLIWGDIRAFITDEILNSYDKFFSRGHCTVYRNNSEVNKWYRTLPDGGCQKWHEVFQCELACCFDEWAGHCGGGMSQIIKQCGIKVFDSVYTADINVNYGRFIINRMDNYNNQYFHYINGKVYVKNKKCLNKEVLCVHFQKRNLNISKDIDFTNYYLIAPNYISSDIKMVKKYPLLESRFQIRRLLERLYNKAKSFI